MTTLTVKGCLKEAWATFTLRPWFFIGVYIIVTLLTGRMNFQSNEFDQAQVTPGFVLTIFVFGIVLFVVQNIVQMGEKKILLKTLDDPKTPEFRDLWTTSPFWRFFLTKFLYGLILLGGLLLLIVPGIIWGLRYMFAGFIIMEKGLKPTEALRESARITNGHKKQLFALILATVGVNIVGALCLLVGLLVTIPVTSLAIAYAYKTLSREQIHMQTA